MCDLRSGRDAGFTVVELVIGIVLSALLMAPLGMALHQALDLIPDGSERTRAATDRVRLLTVFADDIAQAQGIREVVTQGSSFPSSGAKTLLCPTGTAEELAAMQAGPLSTQTSLVLVEWNDRPGDNDYAAVTNVRSYHFLFAPGPHDTTLVNVMRARAWTWFVDPDTGEPLPTGITSTFLSKRMLRGYCDPGDTLAVVTVSPGSADGTTHTKVEVALSLQDTPRSSASTVTLAGRSRVDNCSVRSTIVGSPNFPDYSCVATAPLLTIAAPASLPNGTRDIGYSQQVSATGGSGTSTWSAAGLPAGMSISSSGTITGTPTAAGAFSVTVGVADGAGATASRVYPLTINVPPPAFAWTSCSVQKGKSFSKAIGVSGGAAPFTFSASGLPAWLTLSGTGVLATNPTAPNTTGNYGFIVGVTDAAGASASAPFTITVVNGPGTC